jgi:hypothetical protein
MLRCEVTDTNHVLQVLTLKLILPATKSRQKKNPNQRDYKDHNMRVKQIVGTDCLI